ncbi:MAG: oligosaccharide flippase family protein, partial [Humidesulfovibrio sp.]|nr:oligosaccharide flippase family protein [Humidesulfovibrio sp.]
MNAPSAFAEESLTRQVASGMLWVAGSAVVGRLASFGSQLVLGWLLTPEDFALYAIAVSVSALLWVVKNGGLREVLTQRGREYDALAPAAWRIALGCNVALALALVAL